MEELNVKKARIVFSILGAFGICGAPALSQAQSSSSNVSRATKAVNYRRAGSSTNISFQGTELMSGATGEARVQSKSNRIEIEAKFVGLDEATKFGLEYLTYILWAVSPGGRAVNLGEVVLKAGSGQVKAIITDMQTFGMIVTAEPYFAVTQPGNTVILENVFGPATLGKVENIDAKFELIARGAYSSSNTRIENAIFGIDRKTPLEVFEARNAVRIAHIALADKYAPSMVAKAEQQLRGMEEAYAQHRDRKSVEAAAREVVGSAEEARFMAVKQKAEEDANAKVAAEKRAAEEQAAAEAKRRQAAEQARIQAEKATAEAQRMKQEAEQAAQESARQKQEAEQAAQESARQKQEAEQARAAALAQQQAAQAEAEKSRQAAEEASREKAAALAQERAAEAETEKARQATARAEAEKGELRAQLLNQLNSILQTRDSARGLIVNMSDVLFDTGSYTLRAGAREKLAKISGIVLAHPGLNLQVEGHTDSVGSDEFNQQLSERRAGSVRDFLVQQGVTGAAVSSRGFGKTQPVATNDTPEGRQRNRRVELVVNGEAIGSSAANTQSAPQ